VERKDVLYDRMLLDRVLVCIIELRYAANRHMIAV